MQELLTKFLDSPFRNKWLESEQMKVYVRKGVHLGTDHKVHHYLDIANVVVEPEFRRQGHFKAFLALCQEIQPYDGLKLENVLNEDLCAYLRILALSDHRWKEFGMGVCPDFLWENFEADCQD
jgi:ribosomal protein S18 acetylase RimI-like enzyme